MSPAPSDTGGRTFGSGPEGEHGQSTVELALVLPVLVAAMLAVVQIGVIGHSYLLLWHAARESARAAAVSPTPAAARSAAVASSNGLDPARLTVALSGGATTGAPTTASLTYRVATDVPVVGRAIDDVTLKAEVTMRVE